MQDPDASPQTLTYDSAIHPGPLNRYLADASKPDREIGYLQKSVTVVDVPADPGDPTANPPIPPTPAVTHEEAKFIKASAPA